MLMSSQQQKGVEPRQFVVIVEENDVLLGRGNHVHNPGNAKFRMLVLARSVEYWSCNNNVTKDAIARQIIDLISSLGGRFLRKLKKSAKNLNQLEQTAAGSASTVDESTSLESDVWELADMETILVKVKQTFRDFTASAKKRTTSTSLTVTSQQHAVPFSSLIRPSSNTTNDDNTISNILIQDNARTASSSGLGRLEHSLLSAGTFRNTETERITPSTLSTGVRDSLYQGVRVLQQEHLQNELINRAITRSQFEELLKQQREIGRASCRERV